MSIFIFRTDGNSEIGLGHIMRCLSIADACRRARHKVLFVLADQSMEDLVENRGYRVYVLNTDYRHMDEEIPLWQSGLCDRDRANRDSVICVVDSYYVSEGFFRGVRNVLTNYVGSDNNDRCSVVYIDDLAISAYPVDVLINYNIYGSDMDYRGLYEEGAVPVPRLLLGTEFVPIREQFQGVLERDQKRCARDVLISTGGSDPEHLALDLVSEIGSRSDNVSGLEEFSYHILVGMANGDLEKIRSRAEKIPSVIIHENVSDMRTLISSCDIAVSAAGSTMYEICACGVPVITYVLADNQFLGAEAFERRDLALNLGDMRSADDSACRILDAISDLAGDYGRRIELGRRMQEMVDGSGADRIVKRILEGF